MGMFFKLHRLIQRFGSDTPPGTPVFITNPSTSLSAGTVGEAYSTVFTAAGGVLPYTTFFVTDGELPTGLTLSTGGTLTGEPSTTGPSTFTVRVVDSTGSLAFQSFSITVASSGAGAPLSFATSTGLAQGRVSSAYSQSLSGAGGVAPYRNYVIAAGELPTGLSLSSATGAITGTPSTTGVSTFTAELADSTQATVTQQFRLAIASSAVSSSGNDYFETLVALPEHATNWSLRSQSQLNALVNTGTSTAFQYIWPTDGYTDPQDGAKLVHPVATSNAEQAGIASNQQLVIPLRFGPTGRVLITWDFFYGQEFYDNIGGVGTYKTFQIRDHTTSNVTGAIYFETRNRWSLRGSSADVVSMFDNRVYPGSTSQFNAPDGFTKDTPYTPTGEGAASPESYPIKHGVWTRYWAEVRLAQPANAFTAWSSAALGGSPLSASTETGGTWNMLSLWVADENREPVRTLFRVPWKRRKKQYLGRFDFEFNTSTKPSSAGSPTGHTGPVIGYGRNVVVLHDYVFSDETTPENDATIFVKPV